MDILLKLLRESYDLQEQKPNESAYWHLQKLRESIKDAQIKDESKVNNVVLDTVIKCEYCGDAGRVEPTLQYPDGIKCCKCP